MKRMSRTVSQELQEQIAGDETDTESEEEYSLARVGTRQPADCITDLFKRIDNIRFLRAADGWLASGIMLCILFYSFFNIASQIWVIFHSFVFDGQFYAIRIARLAGDATFSIVLFLVCLFWHTLCFKNDNVRDIWKGEAQLIGSVMSGGFVPKPAAASMGLLLFVTSNLLGNDVAMGDAVFEGLGSKFDSCVANSLEIDKFPAEKWFQRLNRETPEGCYMVENLYPEYPWLGSIAFEKKPFFSRGDGASADAVPGLMHPVVNGTKRTDLYCTYYCSAFNSVALSDIVTSIGEITAGAAVVSKVSDLMTTHLGWHLVTDTTSAQQLVHAMLGVNLPEDCNSDHIDVDDAVEQLQNVHIHRPGSPLCCALQLLVILYLSRELSPRVSINGSFTVDYYTTFLMVMSSLFALILRFWSPYNGRSVIYTRNLWTLGHDWFLEYNPHHKCFEEVKFNLYDWLHTPSQERKRLLLHYCRRVTMGRLVGTYNQKGFIPELEAQETAPKAETHHGGWATDLLLDTLGMVWTCVGYVVCPWRLLHLFQKAQVNPYETQRIQCDTTCPIYISTVYAEWKIDKKGEPICDEKNHRVVIDAFVNGTIMAIGTEPNTVEVEFTMRDREPGDVIALYVGKNDEIEYDETGKKVKNTPVPATGERDGQPVWTFTVPVDNLRETSDEWKFVRKLFGEKSLKKQVSLS